MRTTSPSPGMRQSQTTANETRNPSDSRAPRRHSVIVGNVQNNGLIAGAI